MRSTDRQELPGTELLRLARGSIEYGLIHGEPLPIQHDELSELLTKPGATFTTLRLEGELRGCCGTLEATQPLAADVTRSAFQAAFRDPRFEPVAEGELDAISLELSVLSALESMPVINEADLLEQLTPGTDGLVIVLDGRRATFLPKVWDKLPQPQQFVAALKNKCGLPHDYWSERLAFHRYSTSSYSESV